MATSYAFLQVSAPKSDAGSQSIFCTPHTPEMASPAGLRALPAGHRFLHGSSPAPHSSGLISPLVAGLIASFAAIAGRGHCRRRRQHFLKRRGIGAHGPTRNAVLQMPSAVKVVPQQDRPESPFFQPWVDWMQQHVVQELGLREEILPPDMAVRKGQGNASSDAVINSWLYVSDEPGSPVRCFRITLVSNGDQFQALNAALYPALSRGPLPVLAIDALCFANNTHQLFCTDWAPMYQDSNYVEGHIEPYIQHIRRRGEKLAGAPSTRFYGEEPEFFSPSMFFARPEGSEAMRPGSKLWDVFTEYCRNYVTMLTAAPETSANDAETAMERQAAYEHFHVKHDPAHKILSKTFGQQWTQEWLQHCCFPAALSGVWYGTDGANSMMAP